MEEPMLQRIQRNSSEVVARPSSEPLSKSKDVFDQDNFDATSYINEMFPTGKFQSWVILLKCGGWHAVCTLPFTFISNEDCLNIYLKAVRTH